MLRFIVHYTLSTQTLVIIIIRHIEEHLQATSEGK